MKSEGKVNKKSLEDRATISGRRFWKTHRNKWLCPAHVDLCLTQGSLYISHVFNNGIVSAVHTEANVCTGFKLYIHVQVLAFLLSYSRLDALI
jgi:hypothetical protein